MPEAISQALALDGLVWLGVAALVAGTVRGFSGFGTALIYLPVAAQVIDPVWCIATLAVMDVFGPLPNLPAAVKAGHRRDMLRLAVAALLTIPFGLMILNAVPPEMFRLVVACLSLGLVVLLVTGVRYRGTITPRMVYGIGATAGLLGGATGSPGPPVILFYMARPIAARAIRANVTVFLFNYDLIILGVLLLRGELLTEIIALGLVLALPNLIGNLIGAAIFRPGYERAYKGAAYLIIAASALSALSVW